MTLDDLSKIADTVGATDIPDLINNYTKCLAGGNSGMNCEVNTDFDYKTKKSVGPIMRCVGTLGDNLLEMVPAIDYYHQRWFVTEYLNLTNIQAVFVFAQTENKYHKALRENIDADAAAGKFVNRQDNKLRHYDKGSGVDPRNTNPNAQPVYEARINNDEDTKRTYPPKSTT